MNVAPSKQSIVFYLLTALVLVTGILDYDSLPFWKTLGLDFHNIHAFHNCEHRFAPYLIPGADCGDVLNRPMYYPPLLYWAYFWTAGLSFESAYAIWVACLTFFMVGSFFIVRHLERSASWFSLESLVETILYVLLLGTTPFIFALERGNTDCLVVFGISLCLWFFVKRRYFIWGALSAAMALFKLYPAIPCFLVFAGFTVDAAREQKFIPIRNYLFGAGLLSFLVVVSLWQEHLIYLFDVLPDFSKGNTGANSISHSIMGLETLYAGSARYAKIALFVAWLYLSIKKISDDPVIVFTGTLAVSTFFAGTSYDYNLVTCFPLLFVLFVRSKTTVERGIFLVGL
ncbi:MAG: DUF2029 domain-containing protein, partial [Bdellovibrionales bacterium]|nr:DUF2029 domain-containing protein [Bdellovibrionales bacterium]